MNGHPIGTRVRIARTVYGDRIGMLATVTSVPIVRAHEDTREWMPVQDITIDGLGARSPRGTRYASPPDWLEPIRDDWDTDATPNAVASWAGGVWTPHREVVRG